MQANKLMVPQFLDSGVKEMYLLVQWKRCICEAGVFLKAW